MLALLLACPICFGDPNSQQAHGARVAVLFMLALVIAVLTAIALVARSWVVREREMRGPG
jgi:uncharacterized membrane protein YozB (DUF420 family)